MFELGAFWLFVRVDDMRIHGDVDAVVVDQITDAVQPPGFICWARAGLSDSFEASL